MIKLLHGNQCPRCMKVWEANGDLIPNTKDRDFYGGRVKFFKKVICDCDQKYVLLIGMKDTNKGREYPVIDIAEFETTQELKSINDEKTLLERKILSAQTDVQTKMNRLSKMTAFELRQTLEEKGIEIKTPMNRKQMAKKIIDADPNSVIAQLEV